jgi:hypothetical protein
VEALTPRLVAIAFPSPSFSSDEEPELPAAYLHALLAAIRRAGAGVVGSGYMRRYMTGAGRRPTRAWWAWWAILSGCASATESRADVSISRSSLLEGFLNEVFRKRQQAFAAVLFPAFLEGKIDSLAVSWRAHHVGR